MPTGENRVRGTPYSSQEPIMGSCNGLAIEPILGFRYIRGKEHHKLRYMKG